MAGVKIIVRNNDGDLVQLANYLDREGWDVVQNAEEGANGQSTLYLDDLDESVWTTLGLDVGARRQIRLVDYTTNKIVHFGYTASRRIKRRYDNYGSSVGRAWSIDIWDANTVINRRVLTHHGAKRPRETDVERIQWLITAHEWDIIDQFIIGTGSEKTMSKADYRGQMVNDVISDCAQQAGKNYWCDIVDDGAGDRLTFWYGKDNRDYYYSDVSISNDLADVDVSAINNAATTDVYPPWNDTEYEMNPDRVFTGVAIQWEKGLVYRHSPTGDTQYERWDTVMQAPNIHEKDRAVERALNMLERLVDNGEDVRITSGVLVAAADAHRIRAGMRIPVKLTHIPEMVDYVDCRILSRGLSPRADGYRYWISLTLEPIGPSDVPVVASCSTSLSSVVAVGDEDSSNSSGAMTASITPTAGEDSAIIVAFISRNQHTPDSHAAHLDAGPTEVYADQTHGSDTVGPWEHPTWCVGYDNVVAAAGASSFGATWTASADTRQSSAAVLASFLTAATSPVQEDHDKFSTSFPGTVTMGASVTAGNMLVMVVTIRDSAPVTTDNLYPATGWTQLVTAESQNASDTSPDSIGIYARCVESGDGDAYGLSDNNSKSHSVTVMEWAVT